MAIAMLLDWPGATLEEYDRVMAALGLDESGPEGGIFHVAGDDDGTLRVLDVWESQEAWNAFLTGRLMAAIESLGKDSQPNVRTYPIHNVFVPDPAALESLSAPSPAAA